MCYLKKRAQRFDHASRFETTTPDTQTAAEAEITEH